MIYRQKMFKSILVFLVVVFFGLTYHGVFAAPPANFQSTQLIGSGLDFPTGIGVAPDGRIFILEQSGRIKIYKNGQLLSEIFDELPSINTGDRGLLGIAFDPYWNSNHYVYFYYIGADLIHRVVRFNGAGDVATDGPTLIYSSGFQAGTNHAGGTIEFGPDGKLYISIGDSGQSTNAQDLTNPMGKILRINKDGTVPQDNPFVNVPNARGEIWAYGFRNPFRFQFDSLNGNLYVGDVGEATWEEIDKVIKGGNYGWPATEGPCNNCPYINPVYSYQHTTPGFSVTDGPVYHGSMFPASYDGKLFIGDFAKGFIETLGFDQQGNVNNVETFDPSVGSVVDLKVGIDGSLYFLTIYPGQLYRVTYNIGNQIPSARASADKTSGLEPLAVNFSSQGSIDPEGVALTYAWDFGDHSSSTQAAPQKVYNKRGLYEVRLTVSDGVNIAQAPPITITVGQPPNISILSPSDKSTYKAGDRLNFSATGQDAAGNPLPDSAFTTEILFHHNTHFHPFFRPIIARTGSVLIPQTGESATDVWYEVRMTATDADGLYTTASVGVYPQLVNLTLNSEPQGLVLTLNGQPVTAPYAFESVLNFQYELDAPSQQFGGMLYDFDHWTDGGIKRHVTTVTTEAQEYEAFYTAAPPFAGEYFANINLAGPPTITRNDSVVDFTWNDGSPDPLIPNDNFSVRWTKKQQFQAGRYKFMTTTDDGARLYIDGQLVIDKWIDQASTSYAAVLDLTQGLHDIKFEYYEAAGGALAKLSWDVTGDPLTPLLQGSGSLPSPPPPPSPAPSSSAGFTGEYFTNQTLTGTPALTRTDTAINFVWNDGSPDPLIPQDQFSVRWTKQEMFAKDLYVFNIRADDGVRLFIDNQKVFDKWIDQPATAYTVYKTLEAGLHTLRLEYYEAFGGAIAQFSFNQATATQTFNAEYFTNKDLSSAPALIRQEQAVKFVWNDGSPDPLIPSDKFSARFTKVQAFDSKQYRFTIQADDGVRFWLDDQLIVDDWSDHPMKTYTPKVVITEGLHAITIEYYENTGGAVLTFNQDTP